jgi:prepilin-type N-terminal cleavage/methylation domain-containing protein
VTSSRQGFTIVEVLIAIIVLSIGALALASTAGSISRMMSNGQKKTRSYTIAASKLDSLRNAAYSASPRCSGLVSGSATNSIYGTAFSTSWTVSGTGTSRTIEIRTSYRVGPHAKGDTLFATLLPPCP